MLIIKLIQLAPLLTSTAYLQFAQDETFFFTLFLQPVHFAKSAGLLPSYLAHFSRPAIRIISVTLGIQLLASLAAATGATTTTTAPPEGSFWYWAGFALTVAHFPFAPFAAPLLVAVAKMDKVEGTQRREEEVRDNVEGFLR